MLKEEWEALVKSSKNINCPHTVLTTPYQGWHKQMGYTHLSDPDSESE